MVVVAIIGILAAVAIPAFIEYIRKSKAAEVHENLDKCYKGVVDYFEKPRGESAGTVKSNLLPPTMANPVCPPGGLAGLSGESQLILPADYNAGDGRILKDIGFVVTEATYACYQYTTALGNMTPGEGGSFECQAWTDIDNDNLEAHWVKRGTYRTSTSSWQGGHVWSDPAADNW